MTAVAAPKGAVPPEWGMRRGEVAPISVCEGAPTGTMLSSKRRPRPRWRSAAIAMLLLAIVPAVNPEPALTSASNAYFPASVLSQPVPADAPLAANSDELVQELRNQAFGVAPDITYNCRESLYLQPIHWTADERRWCHRVNYLSGITTDAYAPTMYTVGPAESTVKVTLDANNLSMTAAVAAVPIPAGAAPAPGTDGQMIVWQPATDTMWEFWRARKLTDGWHAGVAGRIQNVSSDPGHYRDVLNVNQLCSTDPTVTWCEQHTWGGPASRIPNLAGLMTLSQLEAGHIDHALSIGIPDNLRSKWAWPAQGSDGPGDATIPQGARFRIDPNLDLNAWFASLKNPNGTPRPVPPILRIMATAAQTYGFVVTDTSAGVSFYGENWHDGGNNVYDGAGRLFGGLKPWQFVADLPWEHMQALREDMCDGPLGPGESTTACAAPPLHVTVPLDRLNDSCQAPITTSPQTMDASGPFVEITTPLNGAALSGWQTFTAFASDPSGVDRVEFYVDGDLRYTNHYPHCALNRMQYMYGGVHGMWDTGSETTGTHVLLVRAFDALGNPSESRVTVRTGPFVPPPITSPVPAPTVVRPHGAVQVRRSFPVEWAPTAPGATAAGYDVNVAVADLGQPVGTPQRWLSGTAALTRTFTNATPGSTYCVSAREETTLGLVSPWSTARCTSVPLDDRALASRRGSWERVEARRSYRHTLTVTTHRGAQLVRRGLLAKRLTVVATRCRRCGSVRVYWNGNPLKRVSLVARTTHRRMALPVAEFNTARRGTVVIKVVSTGRPVRIDGLSASDS
jgi:Bacterial Ig domain